MPYSRYYRYKLNSRQKQVYDQFVNGITNRMNEIVTSYFTYDDLSKVMYGVIYDNPQFYYVDFNNITYVQGKSTCKLFVPYRIDSKKQMEFDLKLNQITSQIIKTTAGKTLQEASLIIHDWLVSNCKYEKYQDDMNAAHTIIGPLLNYKCVCEGYALAYKYLADQIQLRAIVVCGDSFPPGGTPEKHCWNIVMLNKQCYYVDVTFDLLYEGKYCSRAYYLLTTKQISYDHSADPRFILPECNVESNVLTLVSGTAELIDFLKRQNLAGVTHSEVRLSKGFTVEKLFSMMKNRMTMTDIYWYEQIDQFFYGEKSHTLFVSWK